MKDRPAGMQAGRMEGRQEGQASREVCRQVGWMWQEGQAGRQEI